MARTGRKSDLNSYKDPTVMMILLNKDAKQSRKVTYVGLL